MRKFIWALVAGTVSLGAITFAVTTAPSPSADQAAREEIIRRQEAQISAQRLIDQGQKLFADGKFDAAIPKLEEALKILPRADATQVDYNRAARALSECYYRLGDASYRAGDKAKAKDQAKKALEYDPNNRSAENIIIKIKEQEIEAKRQAELPVVEPTPDKTPAFLAKKDTIKKLFREGKILMNSGQYDEAGKRFQEILLLDPYNADAHTLIYECNKDILDFAQKAGDQARERALAQASLEWVPVAGRELPKMEDLKAKPISTGARTSEINKKLNDIVIPEVNFREAVISDVIQFLSEQSRLLDPTKQGVNIVLAGGIGGATTPAPGGVVNPAAPPGLPVPPTIPGAPGAVPPPENPVPPVPTEPAAADTGRRITLNLRNVPLVDALKYVTSLANMKFRVEPSAVLILPADYPEGGMVTRTYPVSAGAFKEAITKPTTGTNKISGTETFRDLGADSGIVGPSDVRKLFEDSGVPFPPGSTISYNERTSTVIVRNTPENLETFERVLSTFNVVPNQVEIEAKFIEIGQQDLDELGFQWKVGNYTFGSFGANGGSPNPVPPFLPPIPTTGASDLITGGLRNSETVAANAVETLLANALGFSTGNSAPLNNVATFRGILTNPQFEVVVKALSQKKSTDTLSAPKITTISGAQAQIRVVQEFIYPTEFEPPQVVAAGGGVNGGGAVGVTPSIPGGFKTREVGVLLNVTPTVGPDGYTINLTLIPEVSEFLGFINYGGPIAIGAGSNIVTTFNDIKQPLFSSRNLTTSIVIWDGQTVVLGGLIREDLQKINDKIPFLGDLPLIGRLWQSKTTVRSKRNLLIFVSANLIDPSGQKIHRENPTAIKVGTGG